MRPSMENSNWPRGTWMAPGERALFVLVGFAHIKERDVAQARGDVVGGDFADLGLRGVQQVPG